MLLSIALIILSGLVIGSLMKRMHLPPIIGYLLAGFLLGPYCLNWLDTSLLQISAESRALSGHCRSPSNWQTRDPLVFRPRYF